MSNASWDGGCWIVLNKDCEPISGYHHLTEACAHDYALPKGLHVRREECTKHAPKFNPIPAPAPADSLPPRVGTKPADDGAPRDELWSLLDWTLWGAGMGDVLREPLADTMAAAITPQQRADALRVMAAWEASGRVPVGRRAYEELKADRDRLAQQLAATAAKQQTKEA